MNSMWSATIWFALIGASLHEKIEGYAGNWNVRASSRAYLLVNILLSWWVCFHFGLFRSWKLAHLLFVVSFTVSHWRLSSCLPRPSTNSSFELCINIKRSNSLGHLLAANSYCKSKNEKKNILLLLVIERRVYAKNSSHLNFLSSCFSSSESSKLGSLPHMKAALFKFSQNDDKFFISYKNYTID